LKQSNHNFGDGRASPRAYWRVEGSLLELTTVRPIAFFTWNGQTFIERWMRRGLVLVMALLRPFLYAANRVFATRVVHTVLRGVSRDRLDLLGEEYFQYKLKPQLKPEGVEALKRLIDSGANVVLVSQGLDHVMGPLARHLGAKWLIANRLEFREGIATGRLLDPVIRPRGVFARITGVGPDGRRAPEQLVRDLGLPNSESTRVEALEFAVIPATRQLPILGHPIVHFGGGRRSEALSVRAALAGKRIMVIGVTGFIGKVWLVNLLMDLPEIGRIYLLIRRQKSNPAQARFEKLVEESPVFDPLYKRYGGGLARFLRERVEVVEGDVSQPGLGLAPDVAESLRENLDLVINSSGLTDFNPDLRDALLTNVDAAVSVVEFVRRSDHAGLLHLSTCYVAGARDGRVGETLRPNYTPAGVANFDADVEWRSLHQFVKQAEEKAESVEITEELRRQAMQKEHASKDLKGAALENQIRKNRVRWLRTYLTEAGKKRANELGWPNTYTLTKSLAESLIHKYGAGLPIAMVRPSIVETSLEKPFLGWNEGINTSAALSYLLGTYFRQLPSNERKRLDVIPVDSVCRGMTLIAAAVISRKHARMYQLATSAINPVNMGRSIELTGLAHRKHYRTQQGIEHWLKVKLETIPVSKQRYERLSIPMQKAVISGINRVAASLHMKKAPLAKQERDLIRAEKLIDLYEPFILHNEHVFECENARLLSAALSPEEKTIFDFAPESIDWWDYWINVHIPALRRWCYPLMEGRPLESRAPRELDWSPEHARAAVVSNSAPPSAPDPLWRSS
jgi:thioester reductase-like protein